MDMQAFGDALPLIVQESLWKMNALRRPGLRFTQSGQHCPHSVMGRALVKYNQVLRRVNVEGMLKEMVVIADRRCHCI